MHREGAKGAKKRARRISILKPLLNDRTGRRRKTILRSLLQGLAAAAWIAGAYAEGLAAPVPAEPGSPEAVLPVPILRDGEHGQPEATSQALLLPDLRTLPPSDLEIQVDRHGERELRLTNIIWNSGSGPLDVIGEFNRATRRTYVRQRVYDQRLDSQKTFQEIPVGEFVWHPTHDHWHMEGFVLYRLWSLTANGGLDRVVSSSDKLSYCLMDTDVIDRQNPGYPSRRRYYECDQTLQGLSAGWGDKYKSYLDGQSLDLSGVGDGFYVLESAANPDGVLLETNSGNNSATVTVEIRGRQVMAIPEEELSERRCDENGWC